MKDKKINKILILVVAISTILAIICTLTLKFESALFILYYPFEIIGNGLRYLSLNSSVGNIISIIIYITISIIPMAVLFIKKKNSTLINIDYSLIGLSLYVFYALYKYINPMDLYNLMNDEFYGAEGFIEIGKLTLAMVFYIILISYFILRALNSLSKNNSHEEEKKNLLFKNLRLILTLFLICDVILIFYFGLFELLKNIENKDIVFLTIKYIITAIPILASIMVIYHTITFIEEFKDNRYGEKIVEEVMNIAHYGKITVYLCVISSLFLNISQLVFAKFLLDVNILLNIPFIPLIVAFLGIILANYFKESKDLFDDNNTII